MPVAKGIAQQLERASWIRRMFEEGARLKKERGADKVFDFTLGNPEVEPPALTLETLRKIVERGLPGSHGYMPNPGFPEVRAAIADRLRGDTGLPFTAEHVCMTVGAAAACNVILKSILDPGDEVILLAPFFAEYPFYVGNHGGRVIVVETDADCLPDVSTIAWAITNRTRAIILNTPNNPSGRVYPKALLGELDAMLSRLRNPPLVISDEPYQKLVYDGHATAIGGGGHHPHRHLLLVVQGASVGRRAHRLPGAVPAPARRRANDGSRAPSPTAPSASSTRPRSGNW